jgi:hypothetical protein
MPFSYQTATISIGLWPTPLSGSTHIVTGTGSTALNGNIDYFAFFTPKADIEIAELIAQADSAVGGMARLGIYSADSITGVLLTDCGELENVSDGAWHAISTTPVTLKSGKLYAGVCNSDTSATLARVSSSISGDAELMQPVYIGIDRTSYFSYQVARTYAALPATYDFSTLGYSGYQLTFGVVAA